MPISERVKQFVEVRVYKFSNILAPKYVEDVFKKSEHTEQGIQMKLSWVYHLETMIMVKTVYLF